MTGLAIYHALSQVEALFASLILLHAIAAVAFFRMSRGSFVPVPLCFAHVALCGWYCLLDVFQLDISGAWVWAAAAANRLFDLEILYLLGAAAYRRALLGVGAGGLHAVRRRGNGDVFSAGRKGGGF